MIKIADVPTSGLAQFVSDLARQNGVSYRHFEIDELADVVTCLADDEVVTDETEDLIVELKRANVIDASMMLALLGNHLDEKRNVRPVQRF